MLYGGCVMRAKERGNGNMVWLYFLICNARRKTGLSNRGRSEGEGGIGRTAPRVFKPNEGGER